MDISEKNDARFAGYYNIKCWRTSADNTRYLAWEENTHNKITNEGLDWINNLVFFTNAKKQAQYLLLVSSNTVGDGTMTYATPIFTESVSFGAVRPAANFVVSLNQSTNTSAAPANFTMNASETEYGAALVMGNTTNCNVSNDKATAGAVLFSYARFVTARAVVATDIVSLTYTATSISNS
jgi:hypothetical protein